VFVIPGFGIAGILGLVFTLGSLALVMINNDGMEFELVHPDEIFKATITTLLALLGAILVMFVGGVRLANSKFFSRIALTEVQEKSEGYTSTFYQSSLLGKTGTAFTVLRPSGKIMLDGEIYDAYTRGEYIAQGEDIEVISTEGTSLKVKKRA